ncbi:MAG: cytochrome C oxidase subunit IV family protein [Planctomycetes bacterium]|nr:cytochrome C oxidase subunit IV family protein [Planctomycetota bacterium]
MSEHNAHAPAADHAHEQNHPHVNYWMIFGILCVLTVISWLADEIGNKGLVLAIVVLAVATAKALFVMMYFMHLKFEGPWKYVLLAPTMVLALAIPAALMPDIGSHYYDFEAPQITEDVASHDGDTHDGKHPAEPAVKH